MSTRRFASLLIFAGLIGGAWYIYKHYNLSGVEDLSFKLRGDAPMTTRTASTWSRSGHKSSPTIRIASWSCPVLDPTQPDFETALPTILNLIRRFDLVGLHGLTQTDEPFLSLVTERLKSGDQSFDFYLGPPVSPAPEVRRSALIFNSHRLEVDPQRSQSVRDPEDVFTSDPLIGWFRARGVSPEEAFTFGVVLVELDPFNPTREAPALTPLYRSVMRGGETEDDILVMGDLGSPKLAAESLSAIRGLRQVMPAVVDPAVKDLREQMFLPLPATAEFTGRAGLIDLVRELNLTTAEAQRFALKAPIWGEFHVVEAGLAWP